MERGHTRFLERRGRAHGEEVVHFTNRAADFRRRDRIAHAPTGDAIGFRQAVDGNGPLGHTGKRRHRDMLAAVVNQVLIDFIGHDASVRVLNDSSDGFELGARKDFARGIVGRI